MPQDTFTLRLVAAELNRTLTGGRINKINQPEREELSFLIYTQKGTLKLTVNANAGECGVYFTDDEKENPLSAPNFCMLLRKHLSSAQILGVTTPGFERILIFKFKCVSDFSSCERELHCEIMGKYSNVILTQNGTVLGALKTTTLDENCKRAILPGAKYVLPSPQDKVNPQNKEALLSLLSSLPDENLSQFLFRRVAGLAPCTAEQIVAGYSGGNFGEYVYSYIFSDEISPCVLQKEGAVTDFFARAVEGAIPFETISAAQSYFYSERRKLKRFETAKRKLSAAISAALKKHEKRLSQIRDKQRECASCEENKLKGELLTANLYALTRGLKQCELPDYTEEMGRSVKIALDPRLSPSENAQAYFKRYRKQKRTLEILAPQEREVLAELDYCQSLAALCSAARLEEDLLSIEEELLAAGLFKEQKVRRKKPSEIPFRKEEREGFTILSGRNNLQNDRLVRTSPPDDLWLHTRQYHSCHVVVETKGREVPQSVLLYAAKVCARHSDAKAGSVAVDYCLVRHVKKPPKSKAGSVLYTNFQTVYVDPSEP